MSVLEAMRAAMARVLARLRTCGPGSGRRRLAVSGLFDGDGYLTAYPDVRASGLAPLDHFILYGWREGRDPNPAFSVRWYLSNNPDVAAAGVNPLLHYLSTGEREGRQASAGFSPMRYAMARPDAALAQGGALAHYLVHGQGEARPGASAPPAELGRPVADAGWAVVKPYSDLAGKRLALLACQATNGVLKPHVGPYAERLARAGYAVAVIACTDAPFQVEPDLADRLFALCVRAEEGGDFAAWSHALRLEPSIFGVERLLLANDSLPPRTARDLSRSVLERMEAVAADFVGLTDGYETEWHIQRDVMLVKPRALASVAFQRFFFSVRSLGSQASETRRYEVKLASTLRAAGLDCAVLYPSQDRLDPAVHHWKALLAKGFPFLKAAVLQRRRAEHDAMDDADPLDAGLDPQLAGGLNGPGATPARTAAFELLHDSARRYADRLRAPDPPLKIDFFGVWEGPGAEAAFGRRLIEAWWASGLPVNLRPWPGAQDRPVIDFEGAADVAVVQLKGGEGPIGRRPLEAGLSTSAKTVGVFAAERRPAGLEASACELDFEPGGGGALPLMGLPPLEPDTASDAAQLARAMVECLRALSRDRTGPTA